MTHNSRLSCDARLTRFAGLTWRNEESPSFVTWNPPIDRLRTCHGEIVRILLTDRERERDRQATNEYRRNWNFRHVPVEIADHAEYGI